METYRLLQNCLFFIFSTLIATLINPSFTSLSVSTLTDLKDTDCLHCQPARLHRAQHAHVAQLLIIIQQAKVGGQRAGYGVGVVGRQARGMHGASPRGAMLLPQPLAWRSMPLPACTTGTTVVVSRHAGMPAQHIKASDECLR